VECVICREVLSCYLLCASQNAIGRENVAIVQSFAKFNVAICRFSIPVGLGSFNRGVPGADVSFVCQSLPHLAIHVAIGRLRGRQPINVAVVHAEGSSDQYGVVYFFVGGAMLTSAGNMLRCDLFAALLSLSGNSLFETSAVSKFSLRRSIRS